MQDKAEKDLQVEGLLDLPFKSSTWPTKSFHPESHSPSPHSKVGMGEGGRGSPATTSARIIARNINYIYVICHI